MIIYVQPMALWEQLYKISTEISLRNHKAIATPRKLSQSRTTKSRLL
ncbi:hypothetical protein [Nostoc sp.]